MEQQDKIRDFFILLWHIFLNDANTKKKKQNTIFLKGLVVQNHQVENFVIS